MLSGASLLPNALPKAQFRAVITCGYGSDLYPLIEGAHALSDEDDHDSPQINTPAAALVGSGHHHGQTKALLPVAGRRMVDWVLDGVEQAGVFDVLVLTPTSIAGPVASHLRARRSAPSSSSNNSDPNSRIEHEEIPENIAKKGTVAVLQWAAHQQLIKSDFILLPCDLLLSPSGAHPAVSLASVLDQHRSEDNLMTALFSERAAGNVVEAAKDGPGEILTIYDKATMTLLDARETVDYEDDQEVPIRTSLLARFPSPTLSTALLPTHLYVFNALLLPFLTNPDHARRISHLETIRELAAFVARRQWRHKGQHSLSPTPASREDGLALGRSTTQKPYTLASRASGGAPFSPEPTWPHTGANTPALGRTPGIGSRAYDSEWQWTESGKKPLGSRAGMGGCRLVIWREKDGWAARGNTVAGWVELNRAALRLVPAGPPPAYTPSGVFISPDSHLHASVYANLGEKVGVKRCIIGKGCFVGKGSKLTNCVVMEGVVIGEKVVLDNCVISNGVQIRDGATLKDCQVGRHVIIDAGITQKGEQIVVEG